MSRLSLAVLVLGLSACGPAIEPVTECPDGAKVVGEAPPDGYTQRCQKGDIRHGLSRSWFENGLVRSERVWWEDELHGPFTMYYENGQKRSEGAHHHYEPTGEWTYWDEEGNVLQHRDFGPPVSEDAGPEVKPEPEAEVEPEPEVENAPKE